MICSTVRRLANTLAMSALLIVLVLFFDRHATTAGASTTTAEPIDRAAVDTSSGSVIFAFSIAAVLIIGSLAALNVRKKRSR